MRAFRIVDSDMCSATIQRMHGCSSLVILSVFIILLSATYVCQQYKQKAFLCVHGNSSQAGTPHFFMLYVHCLCLPCLFHLQSFDAIIVLFVVLFQNKTRTEADAEWNFNVCRIGTVI